MALTARAGLLQSQEPEPGAFSGSHMCAGSQGLGPSSDAFPGHGQSAGLEIENLGHEPEFIWDTSACRWRLAC